MPVRGPRHARRPRPRRARARRAQALVETALTLPIFIVIVLAMIETSRFVYTRSVLQSDARAAARAMAVDTDRINDCRALTLGTDSGGGVVTIAVDPRSRYVGPPTAQSTNPGLTTPGPNQGFVYLYPASRVSTTSCASCSPLPLPCGLPSGPLTAWETYSFVPRVPLPGGWGAITIQVSATEQEP